MMGLPDKLLFLDIDGVLTSKAYEIYAARKRISDPELFCPISCSNFATLIEGLPDFQVVISSAWRLAYDLKNLKRILNKNGIFAKIYDTTLPEESTRHAEIIKWLDKNYGDQWPKIVILDDETNFGTLSEYHYYVDKEVGLSLPTVKQIFHYYGRYSSSP